MSQPEYLEYDLNEIELEEEAVHSQAVPDPPQTPISNEEPHVSAPSEGAEDENTDAESRKQRNKTRESPSSTVSDYQDAYGIPNYDPKRIKTEKVSHPEPPREPESHAAPVTEPPNPSVSTSPPPPESVNQLWTWLRNFSVVYFSFNNHPNVTSAIVAWSLYPKKISSDPDRYIWIHPVILHDSQRITLEYGIDTATQLLGFMRVKVMAPTGEVVLMPYDEWLPMAYRTGEEPFNASKFLRPAEISIPPRPNPLVQAPSAPPTIPQQGYSARGISFGANRPQNSLNMSQSLIPANGMPVSQPGPPRQNIMFRNGPSTPQPSPNTINPSSNTPTIPGAERPLTPNSNPPAAQAGDKEVQIQSELAPRIRTFIKVDASKFFYFPKENVMNAIRHVARSAPSINLSPFSFVTINRGLEAFVVNLVECRCGQAPDVSQTYPEMVAKLKQSDNSLNAWAMTDYKTYISPWSGERLTEVHRALSCPCHINTPQNFATYLPSSRWLDQLRFFLPMMVAYRGELCAMIRSRIHLTEWMVFYQTSLQRVIDFLSPFADANQVRLWYIEEANTAARVCVACQVIYTPSTVSLIMEHQIFVTIQILCRKKQARDAVWLWRLWLYECELRNRSKGVCPVCSALFPDETHGCTLCAVRCVPNTSDGIDAAARAKALTNFLDHSFLTDLFAEMGTYDRQRPGPAISHWQSKVRQPRKL